MKKKYIIEVDESEIVEYWSEQGVREIGYQEYALKSCPNIKVKPYEERPQGECVTCKYRGCDINEKPCRVCSRAYSNLYQKGGADND